jgi:hypothetical protein
MSLEAPHEENISLYQSRFKKTIIRNIQNRVTVVKWQKGWMYEILDRLVIHVHVVLDKKRQDVRKLGRAIRVFWRPAVC